MCAVEIPAMTVTIEEAAVLLGISRRSAYRAADAGQIPTIRIGRRLLVPIAKLLELLGVQVDGLVDRTALLGLELQSVN